jgi:hypothetical protein
MKRSEFYMAEQQINVADKETLDIINSKMDTVDTVVDNIYSKIDTEIDTLTTNLTTVDTVVDGIKTATDRLTSTRAGYIDRIANSTYGLDKIKSTLDTVNTKIDGLNSNGVHGSQTYSTAGTYTWTCPEGVNMVIVSLVGGGGGGGGGGAANVVSH